MEFPPILLAAFLVVIGFIVAMNWGVCLTENAWAGKQAPLDLR